MLLYLLLLLTVIPIVELALLFRIAQAIHWLPTIALVLATGVVGATLARREGLRTLERIQGELRAGKIPTDAMVEGLLILAAGLVLITPGVLTDIVGLLLLVPPCRRWLGRKLSEGFRKHVIVTRGVDASSGEPHNEEFIDVEVTEVRSTGDSNNVHSAAPTDSGGAL